MKGDANGGEEDDPIELLMKHPVAPVVGGISSPAAYLTDEPQPPSIPDGLPEASAKQWMMIYNQNQQRFQRRMGLFKDIGMVLLGYASAQTVMDALPSRTSQLQLPAATAHAASPAALPRPRRDVARPRQRPRFTVRRAGRAWCASRRG